MKHLVKLAMEGQLDTVPTLSMEELNELENQAEKTQADVALDLDEAEKAMSVVGALEDLAFVASEIEEVSPREAALIQIAADATLINTGVDSSAIFPAMEDISNGKSVADRIMEVIKRIVAAVRELLVRIRKNIKNYSNANLQIALQRKKQIKALLAQFKKTDFTVAKPNISCTPLHTVDEDGNPNTLIKPREMLSELRGLVGVNEVYLAHARKTIEDVTSATLGYYGAVMTGEKEKAFKHVLDLTRRQNIAWFDSLPDTAALEDGFEVSDLLMGLRLTATANMELTVIGSGKDKSDEDIAKYFNKCINSFSLQASIYNATVDSETIGTPTPRDIGEMLTLAGKLTDFCLDNGKTLLSEMNDVNDYVIKCSDEISALTEKAVHAIKNGKATEDSLMPHVRLIDDVSRKLTALPHKAFSAVISANLRTVTKVLQIAQKSMHAYDDAEK